MNPGEALAHLHDIVVCKQIHFRQLGHTESGWSDMPYARTSKVYTHVATGFEATISFKKFFSSTDQVDVRAYVYPNGIASSQPIKATVGKTSKVYDENKNSILVVSFSEPEGYSGLFRDSSEVVFVLRLTIDASQKLYFPYSIKGRERYLGAKISIHSGAISLSQLSHSQNVKFATLPRLLHKKIWK